MTPELAALGRLVGTWDVRGEAQERIRYEWAEGGRFLMQHFTLEHGRPITGLEIIGHTQRLGEDPEKQLCQATVSRLFSRQ